MWSTLRSSSDKSRLFAKLLIVGLYLLGYAVSRITQITCIWQYLLGIPCPGCGFTRSVMAALGLRFAEAFTYHPMFWSFPLFALYFVFEGKFKTKVPDYCMLAVLLGFLITWILRLIFYY